MPSPPLLLHEQQRQLDHACHEVCVGSVPDLWARTRPLAGVRRAVCSCAGRPHNLLRNKRFITRVQVTLTSLRCFIDQSYVWTFG